MAQIVAKLSPLETRFRVILIKTATGKITTHRGGLISYKELWERTTSRAWGRGRKNEIVQIITRISAFDLRQYCPPLNELVVRKATPYPAETWRNIKKYLTNTFGVVVPYSSHDEAQEACWSYWRRKYMQRQSIDEAEEGFQQDRQIKFRHRNATLIRARKKKDDYTCQACGFRLQIKGSFIMDCHHKNPLGYSAVPRVTSINELICL